MIHRKYLDSYCSRDRLWKFAFSLCFRELVVFPFQNNHQRTTQSFMVFFFFFFDKFLPFKSFPSDIFLSSKRQKSGSCCNPRGEYKRIFSFFFINFTYKEIKSFAQNELLFRLLPFFGIEILNRGNFSNFTLFLSLILPILIYFLSTWHWILPFVFSFIIQKNLIPVKKKKRRVHRDHVGHNEGCSTCSLV